MNPTDEQLQAIAYFRLGMVERVEAGAGTGKTSTLKLMADATARVGSYVAFNKAIVVDSAAKMPENVTCSTAHSLAFRSVGKRYAHRLDSGRMRSMEVARRLDLRHLTVRYGKETKVLQPGYLASLVQRTITTFCQTADAGPGPEHVPYVEGIDAPRDGRRGWANNNAVRQHVAKAVEQAWADIERVDGELPFRHDHYLKLWQLNQPRIPGDFILFDEAQDASPVMLDAVLGQDAQLVFVGDSQQQIYEWRGAINALAQVPAEATAYLSKSWRFGQPIADVANLVLEQLAAELRLEGNGEVAVVGPIDGDPDAVLCRSNAEALTTVLHYQQSGVSVHLVGGGEEVAQFARAVDQLEATGFTAHPELACFTSWPEVREYVAQDPQGDELKLLVKLVDEFGTDVILKALDGMPREEVARVVVSTAHKAKGREWDAVRIAGDFPLPDGDVDAVTGGEWRLLYVAATRARRHLDARMCDPLHALLHPDQVQLPGMGRETPEVHGLDAAPA